MSIADQITRIKNNIAASYAECSAKGATLPATENSENLPNTIASISSGTTINNQNKTFTENGTYTADAGYTGLGTVTVNVSGGGAGGDSITYTNITGANISKDDKLWINTTATTTEKASVQLGAPNAYVIQTSNPNVAITNYQLYTLQDGAYVQSSLAQAITMDNVGIDKNGLLFSSNTLYNIENNIFYNASFTAYIGNGYVVYTNYIYEVDIANPVNVLHTYSCQNGNQITSGWCFDNDVIIGLHSYYSYCRVLKLNTDTAGFTQIKSLSLGAINAIGQFSEQKIGWGLKGNDYKDLNLGAYRYSRNGDDVNVEEIPATEFPDDMRPMFTEQPSYVFWNEQTLTLTASWASTTPNKVLIFKYINGEWVNKTPIISEFVSNLGYITCDSSVSKIIVSGTASPFTTIIYDGNEKSGGYYGVPYLYSRKETFTAKADEECVNNATSTASAYLPASKIIPPISGGPAGSTPVIIPPSELKFGDRIDNKATVVGTYNSKDLGTVVYAVLDAQYRGANIAWSTGLYDSDIDTGLPNYKSSTPLSEQNHESATYNTDFIINNYSDKKIEAFTFVRNVEPLTYNGKTYKCQLPNAYELLQIFNKKTELDALDPTAETNSTKKLSNWGFGSNSEYVLTSNECSKWQSWEMGPSGSYNNYSKGNGNRGVCPIIEIPITE